MEISPVNWSIAIMAALCMGAAKGGFSGIGALAVVLMASVLPARESTGVVLPLLIAADLIAVWMFARHAEWSDVRRLLPPAGLGIVLGFLAMPRISDANFGPVIGGIVLAMLGIHVLRKVRGSNPVPEKGTAQAVFAWCMGILSGITTMLANAAGPVMTLYLLSRGFDKMKFVGTTSVFFLIVNFVKVPFSAGLGLVHSASLTLNLILLPFVVAGIFGGRWLLHRVSQNTFDWVVLALSFGGALRLVWR